MEKKFLNFEILFMVSGIIFKCFFMIHLSRFHKNSKIKQTSMEIVSRWVTLEKV
jgi:hypothetical protein